MCHRHDFEPQLTHCGCCFIVPLLLRTSHGMWPLTTGKNVMTTREIRAGVPVCSDAVRLLYAAAALLLFLLMVVGFQQFYLHGRAYPADPLPPPIRILLIAHGLTMTLWVVTFVVQSLLIVGQNRRLHMAVGPFAVALAVAMVLLCGCPSKPHGLSPTSHCGD